MKASIRTICPVFNTNRMVHEYAERFYLPASKRASARRAAASSAPGSWPSGPARMRQHVAELAIRSVEAATTEDLEVGSALQGHRHRVTWESSSPTT